MLQKLSSNKLATSKKNNLWILLLGFLAVVFIYGFISYNKFVSKEEKVKNTWDNLQARYQRRLDMIPSLVSVVKASSDYEKNTLVKLTEIRAQKAGVKITGNPESDIYKKIEAEQGDFANTFNRMIAVVEKYPDIKSQQNYVRLQDQIKGTENRIKIARKDFNYAIQDYNTYTRSFPSNLIAKIFGFAIKNGFTADGGAGTAPEINFNK